MPGHGAEWHLAVAVVASLAATATALFRMVADRHRLSDAIAGAVVGVLCGCLVPAALPGPP